jgi:hypothetical protein
MAKLHECVTFLLIFVYTFSVPITTLIRFRETTLSHCCHQPRSTVAAPQLIAQTFHWSSGDIDKNMAAMFPHGLSLAAPPPAAAAAPANSGGSGSNTADSQGPARSLPAPILTSPFSSIDARQLSTSVALPRPDGEGGQSPYTSGECDQQAARFLAQQISMAQAQQGLLNSSSSQAKLPPPLPLVTTGHSISEATRAGAPAGAVPALPEDVPVALPARRRGRPAKASGQYSAAYAALKVYRARKRSQVSEWRTALHCTVLHYTAQHMHSTAQHTTLQCTLCSLHHSQQSQTLLALLADGGNGSRGGSQDSTAGVPHSSE